MDHVISLAGTWRFALDPRDRGIAERWFDRDPADSIQLPGSLQAQGFGDDVTADTQWTGQIIDRSWYTEPRYEKYRQPGHIKIPFWLQPDKHYVGAAWYQRDIEIPAAWTGQRVTLFLERAHIQTRLWLDGHEIGSNDSLSTPHVYPLGLNLAPGRHRLALRVDNRLLVDVGNNSHSVTDHTQSNWNGLVGRLELQAGPPVWIDQAQVHPDLAGKLLKLNVTIGNATGKPGRGWLIAGDHRAEITWGHDGGDASIEIPLDDHPALWDEFNPALHQLRLELGDDVKTITFGLRQLGVQGTQITVNNRPVFLRGTVECCVFPLTGYPPTDQAEWTRILGIIKSYGFNHVRFHSWCPPEAAFAVADEMGLYFQIECASWANVSATLGEAAPIDAWLYEEAHRIIREFGNHPSFLLLAYGNEPGKTPEKFTAYLRNWVKYWKQQDNRRLYTTAAGWPAIAENDFHDIPDPRIFRWGEGLNSRINSQPPATTADYSAFVDEAQRPAQLQQMQSTDNMNSPTVQFPRPIVSHEIGQWCVYPDFSEIPKYTGVLKARNFEIFQESLAANHMSDRAHDFLIASGKLQVLCYKEEIESALRTKGFGGFQVLQANDFPGQGTALVGWLNPFWQSKGYTTPAEFRRFNNATVVLARLSKRIFTADDVLRADLEAAHFGPVPLPQARPYWKLADDSGSTVAAGDLPPQAIPVGNGISLGQVELPLANLPAPRHYRLIAGLTGIDCENDWDIWLYPRPSAISVPDDVLTVHDWSDLLQQARPGRRILFNPRPQQVRGDVALGFSSIFWNTAWTVGQPPHTLGILCDPQHPLLAEFPTESHSNWQWWELIHGSAALLMDGFPPELAPLVQVIDDWFSNRRLGLIFEAKFRGCPILVSGIDLSLTDRHALRQLARSVYCYLHSDQFHPGCEISESALGGLLKS